MLQTVVVDARGHMLGRLASVLAKQLLNGQQVVSAQPADQLQDFTNNFQPCFTAQNMHTTGETMQYRWLSDVRRSASLAGLYDRK